MLMSLGMFVFNLATAPFDELSRQTAYRHARSARFGARDASQYLGPGEDTITLSGTIAPEAGGSHAALRQLREMAEQGEALPLVDGTGVIHGDFTIEDISNRNAALMSNGVARVSEFTIQLRRADG